MKKIGLCLSGGGARGAYEIGVVAALIELEIFPQIAYFSGTSIGAANAGILACNDFAVCKDIWFTMPADGLKRKEHLLKRIREEGYRVIDQGLYEMDLFEEMLWQHVDPLRMKQQVYVAIAEGGEDEERFNLLKSSFKHFIRKESKIVYQKLNDLSQKDAIRAITASCSIPIIFSSVIEDGKKYYDGGIYDNVPVRPLVEVGCEVIIVVHLHRIHLFSANKYPDVEIHEIKHKGSLGGILDFSNEHSNKIYQYGYDDAIHYFSDKDIKKIFH